VLVGHALGVCVSSVVQWLLGHHPRGLCSSGVGGELMFGWWGV
jgi:hypothetical protein